jgi:chromosomal replication initiator protein
MKHCHTCYCRLTDRPLLTKTDIIDSFCKLEKVHIDELASKSRKGHLVKSRYQLMAILYEETKLNTTQIGKILGGRDHTTVLHGLKQVIFRSKNDEEYKQSFRSLKRKILN